MATVRSGVDTAELGVVAERALVRGRRRVGEKAVQRITIYPPTRGCRRRATRSSR